MPIIPVPEDPNKAEIKKREAEKRKAYAALDDLAVGAFAPTRHIVFVPGWAGEEGQCWLGYSKLLPLHASVKVWMDRIVQASLRERFVHYVTFTQDESKACPSFLEFGPLLRDKILEQVPPSAPMDVICHSMGSLDAIAAITQDVRPLRHVVNLLSVGSPLQGIFYGQFVKPVDQLLPDRDWLPHHYVQVRNMNSDAPPMQKINALATRRCLLDRIRALWTFEGTQDMVVMRSAQFLQTGLTPAERRKITHTTIAGAMHIDAAGITHDPRTVLEIVKIVAKA